MDRRPRCGDPCRRWRRRGGADRCRRASTRPARSCAGRAGRRPCVLSTSSSRDEAVRAELAEQPGRDLARLPRSRSPGGLPSVTAVRRARGRRIVELLADHVVERAAPGLALRRDHGRERLGDVERGRHDRRLVRQLDQRAQHGRGPARAIDRLARERAAEHVVEPRRQPRRASPPSSGSASARCSSMMSSASSPGNSFCAGEQLEDHARGAEQVAARIERVAARLLGRHVAPLAHHLARARGRRRGAAGRRPRSRSRRSSPRRRARSGCSTARRRGARRCGRARSRARG